MKKFKITQLDIALLTGFIFCCVTIGFLSWSLNVPLEHVRTHSSSTAWTSTQSLCYAYGKSWSARNGICYMEDAEK